MFESKKKKKVIAKTRRDKDRRDKDRRDKTLRKSLFLPHEIADAVIQRDSDCSMLPVLYELRLQDHRPALSPHAYSVEDVDETVLKSDFVHKVPAWVGGGDFIFFFGLLV